MSNEAEDGNNDPCENCREKTYCIINLFDEVRYQKITNRDDVLAVEMAIGVIDVRESFLRLLRRDLEHQVGLYYQNERTS